jgi:hypothetical protein
MSHVAEATVQVDDLGLLKAAIARLGWTFVEGQTTYKWYGRWVGDYPLPEGVSKDDLGKCEHAVKLPGVNYEIGVVRDAKGGYRLRYDFWDRALHDAVGGPTGPKIAQAYGAEKVLAKARAMHKSVLSQRIDELGRIRIEVS